MPRKKCQRCEKFPPLNGERFCGTCKVVVVKEMHASGYLTPRVKTTQSRPRDACEDVEETKHGPRIALD